MVVGLSRYKLAGRGKPNNLAFADDDARAVRATLLKLGWHASRVKCLIDHEATKANIEAALAGWLTKAGRDDLVVLYWSGHGYPDPADTRHVYFACYDTDATKPYTGWRMDKVVDALRELGTRNVVVIADTCHAGRLITRGDDRALAVRPYVERLCAEKRVPPGWICLVSAEADRKAVEDSKWSNGAFTYCLINGLSGKADANRDATVSMLELKAYMAAAMPEETLRVLGAARHPLILTSSGDRDIWNLTLHAK